MTKNWTIEIQSEKASWSLYIPTTLYLAKHHPSPWDLIHLPGKTQMIPRTCTGDIYPVTLFFYTRKFNLEEVWSPTISYHFNLGIVWWYSKANAYHSYIERANLKLPVIDIIIQSSTFLHKVVLFRFLICEKLTFIHRKKQDSKLSSKQQNRVLGRAELIF